MSSSIETVSIGHGGTAIEVPRIFTGLWQLAGGHEQQVDMEAAVEVMKALVDRGLYAFDMADREPPHHVHAALRRMGQTMGEVLNASKSIQAHQAARRRGDWRVHPQVPRRAHSGIHKVVSQAKQDERGRGDPSDRSIPATYEQRSAGPAAVPHLGLRRSFLAVC